jgi:hypothetical protein
LLLLRGLCLAFASLTMGLGLHLVWVTGLGAMVFNHFPDWISLTGMALVCASGVANALRAWRA